MIHRFTLGGHHIVLDVCSGAVHAVDELAYDMIGLYEEHDRAEVLAAIGEKYASLPESELVECYEQIGELKAAGQLFAPDSFEPLAGALKEKNAGVVKALCLHLQPELVLLLRKPGEIPRRAGCDELRGGSAGA